MRYGQIELPDELLEAHSRHELVIFAGAGLSRPRPSGLPDFRELVRGIEGASGVSRGRHEAFDVYLGRVERLGFGVRREVERRIADPNSVPNRLHRAVARLFPTPELVRIVTTNFDRHLTTAVEERWPEAPEFVAPALPLGEDFHGIVYLHGAIGSGLQNLILTDGDFAVAYLTKGFVRRFLVDLFQKYWLLFLGFSHSDAVLNYLARGLPPGTHRYAIAPETDSGRWEGLGITPITYLKGTRREAVIAGFLEAWGRDNSRRISEHEREVRELVRRGPDGLDPESRDYLLARIRDPDTTAFFCREADDPGWLDWLANVPEFEGLFLQDAPDGEVPRELAYWFAERFSVERPQEALVALARRGGRMSALLWQAVAGHFHRHRPDPDVLAAWLPLLLSNTPGRGLDLLEYLLRGTKLGQDDHVALLLFDFLTEPHPMAKVLPGSFTEGGRDQADIDVAARGNPYWLTESLQAVFKPRIGAFAGDLLAVATKNLERARQLQGGTGTRWDPLSWRRSAIEPHEQDADPQNDWSDVLVDAARESLEWAIDHDRELTQTYTGLWERSRAPILQRLAVHSMRRADWLGPDQKLDWLLDRGWLFATPLHHEVFRLLADAFPAAGPGTRARLLAVIDEGPDGEPYASHPGLRDRARFDLLDWLTMHTPEDEDVKRARDAILGRHPDWQPRKHPDLLMWTDEGDWPVPMAPTVREMLAQDPADPAVLSQLLSYRSGEEAKDWFSSPRRPLLETVAAACREDPGWGLRLARGLARESEWEKDLWRAVIGGWNDGLLESAVWRQVLATLRDHPAKAVHAAPMAHLLEQGVRTRPSRISVELLDLADAVALDIWSLLDGDAGEVTSPHDWLTEAINEPAGQLMIYFLRSLELRDSSKGPSDELRHLFQGAIEGTRRRDSLGASVLASQLHFLHRRDRDWTKEVLVPAMLWDRDARRAQQMWHGFLTWGKLNPALVEDLLPAYMSVFAHIDELGELASRFTEHLALVAFLASEDPLTQGWLRMFVQKTSEERIAEWTHHMTFRLRAMPAADRQEAWRRWIAKYWKQRNAGMPKPLQPREAKELMPWALEMDEAFDEAVTLACAGPRAGAPASIFYSRFAERGAAERHPAAAARLLAHVLAGEDRPFWECDDASEVAMAAARSGQADPIELRAILDELLRLRCPGSNALRGAIEGSE